MIYLLSIFCFLLQAQDTIQFYAPKNVPKLPTVPRDVLKNIPDGMRLFPTRDILMKNGPSKPKGPKGNNEKSVHMKNNGSRSKGEEGEKTSGTKPLEFEPLRSNAGNFVKAIRHRSQDSNAGELSKTERNAIYSLLNVHTPTMTAPLLASTVYSLGMFSQNGMFSNGKARLNLKEETKVLSTGIHRVASQLSSYDMVQLVVGMARNQAEWSDICQDDSLSLRLGYLLQNMDDRAVGDTIWSIGSMGAKWKELPKILQTGILLGLEREGSKLNSFALSSALWSIAKMGGKWSFFSKDLQDSFLRRAQELGPLMSPQQSSKLVWALGTMGANSETFPDPLLELHVINVGKIKKSQVGFAVSASQTLTGVAKTGVTWDKISVTMKSSLWEQLVRICQSNNDRGIANAIWSLGTIGTPMTVIPLEVKELMLASSANIMKECSSWAFCNIIWGLAKMKFTWADLPKGFRDTLMQNAKRLEKQLNSVDVGILIWSLGALDTPLDTLPVDVVESLLLATLRNLETMRAQELSRTIWGLSGSGLDWDSIPAPVRWSINVALRRVGEEMSPQDVANCAYGLALLAFDSQTPQDAAFRGCHEVLLNTIRKTQRTADSIALMNDQELEQIRIFSHYLKVFSYVIDDRRIPSQLLSSANGVVDMDNIQGSRLQRRVVKGLRSAFQSSALASQYDIELEVSSFDGSFPLDAQILKNNKVVAFLEVDGPSHYRPDGRLRRKDQLKEAMYLKKHAESSFHRIRWDEADKVGTAVIGAELAALVMSRNVELNKFDTIKMSLQNSCNNFINWCLRNSKE